MKKLFFYLAILLGCIACAEKGPILMDDYTFSLSIDRSDTLLQCGTTSSYYLKIHNNKSSAPLLLSYLINNSRSESIKIDGTTITHDNYSIKDSIIVFSFTPKEVGEYTLTFIVNNDYYKNIANLSLYSKDRDKYIATIKATSGGSVTPSSPVEVAYMDELEISAVAENYYHFVNWSDGSIEPQRNIIITQDTTLTASFEANIDETFTPTLTLKDCNNYLETKREIVLDLSSYTKEAITLSYRINNKTDESISLNNKILEHNNYSLNTSIDKKFTFIYVPSNVEDKTLQITLTLANEYKKNLEVTIPVIATPKSNLVLSVQPDVAAGVIACDNTSSEVKINDTLNIIATANAGYSFSKFIVDNATEVKDNPMQLVVTEDYTDSIRVAAVFTANEYKLAFTAGDGGSVTNAGGSYEYNSNISSSAVADKGYQFIGWYLNNVLFSSDKKINVTVDLQEVTYKACFEKVQYTASAVSNPAEGGTLSGIGDYYYNDALTITATPTEGYIFNKFVVDDTEYTANPLSLTMQNSDLLIEGYFTIITSNYVFTAGDGGSVTNAGGTYNYGQVVTTKAEPHQDMRFVGWYKDNVLAYTSPELSLTVGKDNISLEARFETNLRTITLNNANPTRGDISGAGIYNYQSSVTLTATPIRHYHFVGWYENDVLTTSNNPYTFNVERDRYFIAKFSQNEHTITTIPGDGYIIDLGCTVKGGDNKTINITIKQDYKLTGFAESNFYYDVATQSITLTDIDQDYTITPKVRYNIITFTLDAEDNMLNVHASQAVPCDITISIASGQYLLTMQAGTNHVSLETSLDTTQDYSIEYVSGNATDGYILKY